MNKLRSLAAAALIAVAGCAVVAGLVLPPSEAAQLGARMAHEIETQRSLHPSAALQARVARIGERVLAAAGEVPEAYEFSFKVLAQPEVLNAFALPGGRIYVTSGLVEAAASEAELASVLAHEVAHVTERHIAERLAATYGAELLASAALGQNPGMIAQLVGPVLQQGVLLKYSREQELDADAAGLRYLARAGYDPHAAIAMFRKLEAGGGSSTPAFLSTHPATGERIEQLEQIIASESR